MYTYSIQQIKKRNGDIVDFEPRKIAQAIEKAFIASRGSADLIILNSLVQKIIDELEKTYTSQVPAVENVQNHVERALMHEGAFDVAKSYIIYRYEHTKIREEKKKEIVEKIARNELSVLKRDGSREFFDINKIKKTIKFAISGYEDAVDVDAIATQCESEIYDGISSKDISKAIIMTTRSFIEQDPAYSFIAARLLMFDLYKKVIGIDKINFETLETQYRQSFIDNIKKGVEIERLDPKLLTFDLEELSKHLDMSRDSLFNYLGIQTIADRYLIQNPETKIQLETPQAFWMRIAMGCALNEKKEVRTQWVLKFYDIMSKMLYTPSTPTLFHAGTPQPQLSSCYLNTVGDSLDNIYKTYADNAQLSKWSGGIGTDWTNVRSTGSFIKGTGVESQGVIPFLKIANDSTIAINRSGKRRGAACVYLECWHLDFEDFCELRKNTGDERRRTHDMDTASWIPDLFMKRVRDDKDWTLFSPDEVSDLHHIYGRDFEKRYTFYEKEANEGRIKLFKTVKARDIWKKIIGMLFETGHPWITFKDPCNIRSPQDHVGVVHNSNLCTEITLNTSEDETAVCNLGSLNFAKFINDGVYDVGLVQKVVTIAMRMLDNVIDINFYPTADARRSNLRHRPVGLGVRGFQDALYLLGIDFDSDACIEFSDYSMEVVSFYTLLASSQLAKERGTYQTYKGSKWDRGILPQDTIALLEVERGIAIDVNRSERLDWSAVRDSIKKYGMRNSNCLAIAPTATTANIVGCIPTVEPTYKNLFVKSNQAGDFIVINNYLVEDLKKLGLWDFEILGKIKYHDGSIAQINEIPLHIRNKYKEVFDIDPIWLLKAAAHRGKWIDQSQSLNIYFKGNSGKEVSGIYMTAWELGLKTTYYLRSLAASQVEKSTVNTTEYGSTHTRQTFNVIKKQTAQPELKLDAKQSAVDTIITIKEPTNNYGDYKANLISKQVGVDEECEACQA